MKKEDMDFGYRALYWVKDHPLWSALIVICLVIAGYFLSIVVTFSLINYQERKEYGARNAEIAKIVPFSQRGLPVPETDIPVTLPPDPGEAGKATLAGVDSNNDGIRDDLEREIVYMYPQNEEVRRVLRQMVRANQDFIVTEGTHEHFKALALKYFDFKHCYFYLVFGPIGPTDFTNSEILDNLTTNTTERKQKDEAHQKIATPYVTTASPNSCDPVKGKY